MATTNLRWCDRGILLLTLAGAAPAGWFAPAMAQTAASPQGAEQPSGQGPAAEPTEPDGPVPAPQTSTSPQQSPSVEFSSSVRAYSLIRDSAAYAAASLSAPQLYPLRAGTPVQSVEASRDGHWIIAMTGDGQAAFLPVVDLGPYDPSKAPRPDFPTAVAGVAQVIDTATLDIAGGTVPLAGVQGETGRYARQMEDLIRSQGMQVRCELGDNGYRCLLPNGIDIARMALFNGAADASPDASDDYQRQAQAAQAAHRGLWKTRAAPSQAILPIRTGLYVSQGSDCTTAPQAAMIRFRGDSFAFPQAPQCRVRSLTPSGGTYALTQSCTNAITNVSSDITQTYVVLTDTEFTVSDSVGAQARYRWCSP